jgi:hypothetical protein
MLCLSWIVLVLCTYIMKPKKVSSVARLPNENGWKISERKVTRVSDHHHPYTRKHSTSFENPFQYNATPIEKNTYRKYSTPIAPHIEKLQLPESYDNRNSNSLSRHHLPSTNIPGSWVEYASAPAASPYYYQDHSSRSTEENP